MRRDGRWLVWDFNVKFGGDSDELVTYAVGGTARVIRITTEAITHGYAVVVYKKLYGFNTGDSGGGGLVWNQVVSARATNHGVSREFKADDFICRFKNGDVVI